MRISPSERKQRKRKKGQAKKMRDAVEIKEMREREREPKIER